MPNYQIKFNEHLTDELSDRLELLTDEEKHHLSSCLESWQLNANQSLNDALYDYPVFFARNSIRVANLFNGLSDREHTMAISLLIGAAIDGND